MSHADADLITPHSSSPVVSFTKSKSPSNTENDFQKNEEFDDTYMNTRRRKIEARNISSQLSIEILESQTSKSVHNLENDEEEFLHRAKRVRRQSDEFNSQQLPPCGTALHDLIERLDKEDVMKIQNAIKFPAGLSDECSTPEEFLLDIDTWEDYNSKDFFTALSNVRPDLVHLAKDIPFLQKNFSLTAGLDGKRQRMKKFVAELKNELKINRWRVILKNRGYNTINNKMTHADIFAFCLEKNIITKDLDTLTECLENIRRNDLAAKMITYKLYYSEMSTLDFEITFKDAIGKIQL